VVDPDLSSFPPIPPWPSALGHRSEVLASGERELVPSTSEST
jgi:hypothetical protein